MWVNDFPHNLSEQIAGRGGRVRSVVAIQVATISKTLRSQIQEVFRHLMAIFTLKIK